MFTFFFGFFSEFPFYEVINKDPTFPCDLLFLIKNNMTKNPVRRAGEDRDQTG